MARDSQTKLSKREQSIRSKKQEEINKRKKKIENSDSDDNNGSESDNDEMDVHEYRKFISKIFPSKHINKKIQSGEKLKNIIQQLNEEDEEDEDVKHKKDNKKVKKSKKQDDYDDMTESSSEEEIEKISKKSKKTNKKSKKIEVSDDEEELWETASENEDDDEEDDDESEFVEKPGKGKLNIIFTIGGGIGEEEDEWDDEDDSDYEEDDENSTEDEDEEVSTDDDSDEVEEDDESEEEEPPKKRTKTKKSPVKEENKVIEEIDVNNNVKSNETLEQLKKLMEANPSDKSIQRCIEVYEEDLKKQKVKVEKKDKKQKAKNMRIFRKIIKDKNTLNDFTFYEKLDTEHQKKIIKELKDINKITRIEKPYRITLLESTIPVQFKAAAMKKINSLRYMEPGSGEFYKIKNWVDTFMRSPFNKHEGLPISIDDGVEKCHEFMENAQKTLDEAVYGLNDAKMQIMQMLGQLLTNPKAIGTAIAIHGPPGTGKTSLVKEGISKILNRPFAFIALGGATDSSFLEGHGYTYEGSTWGKIVQILIDSKCMNPVIYFDELDKISDTPRGEEIAGILTHLTDTTQNSQFHDKYFAEINFDLSKCLFIFSYNDENKVNSILKDRMYIIKTKGYISKEKTIIANNYLIPKIREQVRFTSAEIEIPNDVIGHIIDIHCNKEDGVRNLKRCLEIIYTKLNLYRLMKPGTNLFEGEMALKVEFPFKVTKEIVDKLIKKESDGLETWRNLYV